MSEPNEVTTEPTTTIEQPAPPAGGSVSRDDLIAAVRAAGGTESVDVDAEAAAAGQPPPVVEPEPAPAPSRLETIMRRREEVHAETLAQRQQAQRIEDEARERADRLVREAEQRAKQVEQDAAAERRRRFQENPTEALRELGDPQKIIDGVLQANDPTQKAIRSLQAELEKEREVNRANGEGIQTFKQWKEQKEQAEAQAAAHAYEQNFLATVATETAAPHLNARYTPDQIVRESRATAEAWAKDGLRYRVDFDDADIVSYLEDDSKKRIAKLIPSTSTPPANQVSAGALATAPGNAPKVQANGPRTLSAAQGSERRTSPKPLHEMNEAQKRAALIEAAAEARRNNPDGY